MRALIVDDMEEGRYLLQSLLIGNGYEVEVAENGAEALEKIKTEDFDLIISDILMPVMDGFQLCRKVKTDENLRHIPFIFYTATYTGPKDEAFAIKIGADRFIVKPCEPDVLIETIQGAAKSADNRNIEPKSEPMHEEEILKLYNERLVRKLEKKTLQLEKEILVRQETEEELRRANSFLDSIIENIPDMIFLKDANELRFVSLNKAGENLLGYSREKILGKTDYDFFPKDQADFFTQQDRTVLEKKEIIDIPEEEILTCSKKKRILHTKKVPLFDADGNPLYLLGISEDITELKTAQEESARLNVQLLHAQKLESLGNLAGGVAHDFNNILSAIIGFTEIALDGVQKGSTIEDDLQEVYKAGKRAKDLVKQILTIASKSDEEVKPVKAKNIVEEALQFLRSSIPTSIEIQQKIKSESSIMGNPTQLHQILMNLCTNAMHAMEESGGLMKIVLDDVRFEECGSTQVLDVKPGDYIKLSVSDTGSGISPKIIGSIFDPYFTTKEPGEGTGLGLALVHGIVEKYGGDIEVFSELGQGSIFSIYLPIIKTSQSCDPYVKEDLPTGSERILFVDDEPSIAHMCCQMLERFGYSVTCSISSVEALDLFQEKPDNFDLVITDMTMPKMTGDKLAAELMKIRQDIPVILFTGYSKKMSDKSAADLGIKAFAYKPIDQADLVKMVRKILDEAKS
ncbi:response regulator [uncultured Desulfobacter sp.]|uniref:ATP-binding response regulator n=1 Tax=uncultured Desulfobacter sp. TaxID=240139 RepID=UPI0029F476D0|nr:response regulator [uncultured Desulfobacter sp.]